MYPFEKAMDSLFTDLHAKNKFNGTVLVADSGIVRYQQAFGVAEVEPEREMKNGSVFYLGSLAKQFTGMSILLLQADGKLSYSDPLSRYFPEFPSFTHNISLRQMLTHTSGLPDYYSLGAFKPGFSNQDVYELVMNLDSLDFVPGSDYAYSNTAYVLLSMVAEKAAEKSFHDFLQERVFTPLHMQHSVVYDETQPERGSRALGYTQEGEPDDYNAFTTGGGGIFSNTGDLFLWVKALSENRLLTAEQMKEAYRPMPLTTGELSYYGFGWRLSEKHPHIVQHSGSLAGFRTYLYRNRDRELTIILLSNFTQPVGAINEKVLEILEEPIP